MKPKLIIWKSKDGYRWRLTSTNGRTVAESGEAYSRKRDLKRVVAGLAGRFAGAEMVVEK